MTFEIWFTELKTGNPQWWDSVLLRYGKKDLKGLAQDCFIWLQTQPIRWQRNDYNDFRSCFQKFLMNAPDRVDVQKLPEAEPVVIHPQALTGEARAKRLAEWKAEVDKWPMMKRIPPSERDNGEERLKTVGFTQTEAEALAAYNEHIRTLNEARRKFYRDAYPNADEYEVELYIESLKDKI